MPSISKRSDEEVVDRKALFKDAYSFYVRKYLSAAIKNANLDPEENTSQSQSSYITSALKKHEESKKAESKAPQTFFGVLPNYIKLAQDIFRNRWNYIPAFLGGKSAANKKLAMMAKDLDLLDSAKINEAVEEVARSTDIEETASREEVIAQAKSLAAKTVKDLSQRRDLASSAPKQIANAALRRKDDKTTLNDAQKKEVFVNSFVSLLVKRGIKSDLRYFGLLSELDLDNKSEQQVITELKECTILLYDNPKFKDQISGGTRDEVENMAQIMARDVISAYDKDDFHADISEYNGRKDLVLLKGIIVGEKAKSGILTLDRMPKWVRGFEEIIHDNEDVLKKEVSSITPVKKAQEYFKKSCKRRLTGIFIEAIKQQTASNATKTNLWSLSASAAQAGVGPWGATAVIFGRKLLEGTQNSISEAGMLIGPDTAKRIFSYMEEQFKNVPKQDIEKHLEKIIDEAVEDISKNYTKNNSNVSTKDIDKTVTEYLERYVDLVRRGRYDPTKSMKDHMESAAAIKSRKLFHKTPKDYFKGERSFDSLAKDKDEVERDPEGLEEEFARSFAIKLYKLARKDKKQVVISNNYHLEDKIKSGIKNLKFDEHVVLQKLLGDLPGADSGQLRAKQVESLGRQLYKQYKAQVLIPETEKTIDIRKYAKRLAEYSYESANSSKFKKTVLQEGIAKDPRARLDLAIKMGKDKGNFITRLAHKVAVKLAKATPDVAVTEPKISSKSKDKQEQDKKETGNIFVEAGSTRAKDLLITSISRNVKVPKRTNSFALFFSIPTIVFAGINNPSHIFGALLDEARYLRSLKKQQNTENLFKIALTNSEGFDNDVKEAFDEIHKLFSGQINQLNDKGKVYFAYKIMEAYGKDVKDNRYNGGMPVKDQILSSVLKYPDVLKTLAIDKIQPKYLRNPKAKLDFKLEHIDIARVITITPEERKRQFVDAFTTKLAADFGIDSVTLDLDKHNRNELYKKLQNSPDSPLVYKTFGALEGEITRIQQLKAKAEEIYDKNYKSLLGYKFTPYAECSLLTKATEMAGNIYKNVKDKKAKDSPPNKFYGVELLPERKIDQKEQFQKIFLQEFREICGKHLNTNLLESNPEHSNLLKIAGDIGEILHFTTGRVALETLIWAPKYLLIKDKAVAQKVTTYLQNMPDDFAQHLEKAAIKISQILGDKGTLKPGTENNLAEEILGSYFDAIAKNKVNPALSIENQIIAAALGEKYPKEVASLITPDIKKESEQQFILSFSGTIMDSCKDPKAEDLAISCWLGPIPRDRNPREYRQEQIAEISKTVIASQNIEIVCNTNGVDYKKAGEYYANALKKSLSDGSEIMKHKGGDITEAAANFAKQVLDDVKPVYGSHSAAFASKASRGIEPHQAG